MYIRICAELICSLDLYVRAVLHVFEVLFVSAAGYQATIVLNTAVYLLFSVYSAFAATLLFFDFFPQWCLLLVFMSNFNNKMQKYIHHH